MTTTLSQPSVLSTQPYATPLRGWVNTFYRHYKGKKLGPYHVRRWKVGHKVYKEYIKPENLERVKAACQANRERRKKGSQINRWLTNTAANLTYLMRMVKWEDEGKVRPIDRAFVAKMEREGYDIPGRPPLRRKVTNQLAKIAGERFIVKTVFELDGTTKVFMVPLVTNYFQSAADRFKQIIEEAWEKVHGKKNVESVPSGPLSPATLRSQGATST